MNSITEQFKPIYADFDKALTTNPNPARICQVMVKPGMYPKEADEILKQFPNLDKFNILEIGCAYGGLCKELFNRKKLQSYTVVDNVQVLRFAREYLKGLPIIFQDAANIEVLANNKYDLLISTQCLSETPDEYLLYVLNTIMPNCKNLFIVDGRYKDGMRETFKETVTRLYKDLFDGNFLMKKNRLVIGKNT